MDTNTKRDFAVALRQFRAALSRREFNHPAANRILSLISVVSADVLLADIDTEKLHDAFNEMDQAFGLIEKATEALLTIKIPTYPPMPELDTMLLRLQKVPRGEALDMAFTDIGALMKRLRPEDMATRLSVGELKQAGDFFLILSQGIRLRDHAFDAAAAALSTS